MQIYTTKLKCFILKLVFFYPISASELLAELDVNTKDEPSLRSYWRQENRFGEKFLLVDSSNDFMEFVARKNEFDLFAFMCPFTRYTDERKHYLQKIVNEIGESFFDRCILIFTQCSKEQEGSIEREIESVAKMDKNINIMKKKYIVCPSRFQNNSPDSFRNFIIEFGKLLLIEDQLKKDVDDETSNECSRCTLV